MPGRYLRCRWDSDSGNLPFLHVIPALPAAAKTHAMCSLRMQCGCAAGTRTARWPFKPCESGAGGCRCASKRRGGCRAGTLPWHSPWQPHDHPLSCLTGPWVETARQPHPARFSVSAPGRPGQGLGSDTEPSAGLFHVFHLSPSPRPPLSASHCLPMPCSLVGTSTRTTGVPIATLLLLALVPPQTCDCVTGPKKSKHLIAASGAGFGLQVSPTHVFLAAHPPAWAAQPLVSLPAPHLRKSMFHHSVAAPDWPKRQPV